MQEPHWFSAQLSQISGQGEINQALDDLRKWPEAIPTVRYNPPRERLGPEMTHG